MQRDIFTSFIEWKTKSNRKPIMLRGARQVGKSYLVREVGKSFESFVEINFDEMPDLKSIFERDLSPERIIRDLGISVGETIIPGKTLLFFDEIQECPNAVKSIRYFYEKLPRLHLVTAGSLLDFILEEIGVPVGRIEPLYLYPMSFMEFLSATGNQMLREEVENHELERIMPEVIHNKLISLVGEYMAIGGMPEAVKEWIENGDPGKCKKVHYQIIDTFQQDFLKYTRRNKLKYVDMVFNAIPRLIGNKFVFSTVNPDARSRELRPALELLSKAGVAHIIYHSSSNGVPLGAEINLQRFKVIFMDIALAQAVLGSDSAIWIVNPKQQMVNQGQLAEAFIGQELLAYSPSYRKSSLYYWAREKRGSLSEVDYVTAFKGKVVPVEVKAGQTGGLKSMQIFLNEKKHSDSGILFSLNNYRKTPRITHLPLYAISSYLSI